MQKKKGTEFIEIQTRMFRMEMSAEQIKLQIEHEKKLKKLSK
jgi:hypothetical protein